VSSLLYVQLGTHTVLAGEGLRTLLESGAAMGSVGGRFANLQDPSATRLNPANLSLQQEAAVMVTAQPWYLQSSFSSTTGRQSSTLDPWKPLGSVYSVTPLAPGITFGIGAGVPFGTSVVWPQNGPLQYLAPYRANLEAYGITPAVGIKLNDTVSVGAGLDILYSRLNLSWSFPWTKVVPGAAIGDMSFAADGWGLGAYGGITLRLTEHQRLAFTGRLPVTVKYDGHFSVSNIPTAASTLFSSNTNFQTEEKFPASIGVGYGVDLTDKLTAGLDYEWIQNSSHQTLPLTVGGGDQKLFPSDHVELRWRDSFLVAGGVEYKLNRAWKLRGGYSFSKSPIPNATFNPTVPTNNMHLFSAGTGYTWGRNTVDFASTFVNMNKREVRDSVNPSLNGASFNGDYKSTATIFTLSYTRKY